MIAELLAKIGVDISDLNRAEIALKQFEHNFAQAFRRPPAGEMRQEAALSGALRQIVAGDVPGAIESVLHRIGSIPAAVAVGFGAIILGATKAIQAARALEAQFEDLNKTLSKTPSAAMGVEALGTLISDQAKKIGATAGQHIIEGIGERLMRAPESLMNFLNVNQPFALKDVGEDERKQRQAAIEKMSMQQISDALKEQGTARAQMAEVTDAQAQGDATIVGYKKAQLQYDKEMQQSKDEQNQLEDDMGDKLLSATQAEKDQFEAAKRVRNEKTAAAAEANKATAEGVADRSAMAGKEEVRTQQEIANIKRLGLTADVEKEQLAQQNIQHLMRELENNKELAATVKAIAQAKIDAAKADAAGEEKRRGVKKFEDTFQKSLYTVDELANMPRRGWIGGDMSVARFNAREIQRLENRAQIEKAQGHPMEAFAAMTQAQQIRAGMPLLKASEKTPEFAFAAAIDSAGVFKGMLQNLENISKALGTPNNPFLNKP